MAWAGLACILFAVAPGTIVFSKDWACCTFGSILCRGFYSKCAGPKLAMIVRKCA